MILMLICIGCVKVYLKTKKMTNISQAQAGFKANSRRNPLWISSFCSEAPVEKIRRMPGCNRHIVCRTRGAALLAAF